MDLFLTTRLGQKIVPFFCHSYLQGRFSKWFWTSLILHWRSSIFFEDRKINNRFLTTIKNSRGGTLKSFKAPMQRIQEGWQILENAKQYLPYICTYGWKILYWWYKHSTFCPNYPKEYNATTYFQWHHPGLTLSDWCDAYKRVLGVTRRSHLTVAIAMKVDPPTNII